MTRYQVEPRKKDQRGVFAIYPISEVRAPKLTQEAELGRVKARTHSEAYKIAVARGIGAGAEIWAIEVIPDERMTVLED